MSEKHLGEAVVSKTQEGNKGINKERGEMGVKDNCQSLVFLPTLRAEARTTSAQWSFPGCLHWEQPGKIGVASPSGAQGWFVDCPAG